MPADPSLSWGQRQAGVNFNPAQNPDVKRVKDKFADLMDDLNDLRSGTTDADEKRFLSIALTHLNDAQMEAVKAITWNL